MLLVLVPRISCTGKYCHDHDLKMVSKNFVAVVLCLFCAHYSLRYGVSVTGGAMDETTTKIRPANVSSCPSAANATNNEHSMRSDLVGIVAAGLRGVIVDDAQSLHDHNRTGLADYRHHRRHLPIVCSCIVLVQKEGPNHKHGVHPSDGS